MLNKINHSAIENSMSLLWPNEIKTDNVLLFVTDVAAYTIKAASKIKEHYLKMIHLTCLTHRVHRIAKEIRHYFSDVG